MLESLHQGKVVFKYLERLGKGLGQLQKNKYVSMLNRQYLCCCGYQQSIDYLGTTVCLKSGSHFECTYLSLIMLSFERCGLFAFQLIVGFVLSLCLHDYASLFVQHSPNSSNYSSLLQHIFWAFMPSFFSQL